MSSNVPQVDQPSHDKLFRLDQGYNKMTAFTLAYYSKCQNDTTFVEASKKTS